MMMKRRARRSSAHSTSPESDFDTFVTDHCVRLVAAVYRTCGDYALAEDAVQTALVQLRTNRGSVNDPSKWVYTVALRRVCDTSRSTKRREARETRVAAMPQRLDLRYQPEEWVCMQMHLKWMLRELSFSQRAVMSMWSEGISIADIADILGVSEGTVRSHKCQALKQLKQHFATTDLPGKETKR